MSAGDPSRFGNRWLRFDPQRPARPRLLTRFVAAVLAMLIVSAALAWWANKGIL